MKNFAKSILSLYYQIIWYSFAFFAPLFLKRRVNIISVLHISVISHKPMMLSQCLQANGIKSAYLSLGAEFGWLAHPMQAYDYNLPRAVTFWQKLCFVFKVISLFIRVLSKFSIIHYHFNSTLLLDGIEVHLLRRLKKKIIFHFRGCDLRQGKLNQKLNPELNCCRECDYPVGSCETKVQYKRLETAKRFAHKLFVTTPDLLDFMPSAIHIPFIEPFAINIANIVAEKKAKDIFRVVTSSNHHGVDGTAYIRRAVDRLQGEGEKIELIIVEKTPYEKTLAIYASADLYVGKLRMGYYNNAHIECMILGVPVMCYIRPSFHNNEEIIKAPIINANIHSVYDKLKDAMKNKNKLKDLGQKGPGHVEEYHSAKKVFKILQREYEQVIQ